MFEEFITRIKTQQDNHRETISALRPDIVKFQKQLVDSLTSFINQAKENGITGVKSIKKQENKNGVVEYYFQIADEYLLLVINDRIEKIYPDSISIGNYSFIYRDDSDNATPYFQICVFRNDNEQMMYSISWFLNGKKRSICENLFLEEDSGELAAGQILHILYSGDLYLRDYPTLKEFHMDSSQKGSFGFLP